MYFRFALQYFYHQTLHIHTYKYRKKSTRNKIEDGRFFLFSLPLSVRPGISFNHILS